MGFEESLMDAEMSFIENNTLNCQSDGKTCKNCSQIKLGYGSCIDMTCWRGYVDGDHDGWIKKTEKSEINLYEMNSYELKGDDDKVSIGTILKKD